MGVIVIVSQLYINNVDKCDENPQSTRKNPNYHTNKYGENCQKILCVYLSGQVTDYSVNFQIEFLEPQLPCLITEILPYSQCHRFWNLANLISIVHYWHYLHTRREFSREILYNNIAIIAIQHSKIYFVGTFGGFSHIVEWNSLKSVWKISLHILP